MYQWKQKMTILMVTFVMVGVWFISIPIVAVINGVVESATWLDFFSGIFLFVLGTVLFYLGMSTYWITIIKEGNFVVTQKQLGFLTFQKKYSFQLNEWYFREYEDEDGIIWYDLKKQNEIALESLNKHQMKAIKDLLSIEQIISEIPVEA